VTRTASQTSSAFRELLLTRRKLPQKILPLNGGFPLPFRPLAGETITSTKGTTINRLSHLKKLAFLPLPIASDSIVVTTTARHQKQIEPLFTDLQRVSAQIEVTKPSPQTGMKNR
jgi:hypothetical protein